MELHGPEGGRLRLRPVRYESDEVADWHDANWLVVAGDVATGDGSWSFSDPCLLTVEARELGTWLHRAADGHVAPPDPDQADVWPDLSFIEPNLGFGVAAHDGATVTIRVHLSLEAAPPWEHEERRVPTRQWHLDVTLPPAALHRAADVWLAELAPFPERPAEATGR